MVLTMCVCECSQIYIGAIGGRSDEYLSFKKKHFLKKKIEYCCLSLDPF